jgi:hypothetical protein
MLEISYRFLCPLLRPVPSKYIKHIQCSEIGKKLCIMRANPWSKNLEISKKKEIQGPVVNTKLHTVLNVVDFVLVFYTVPASTL